LHKEGFWWSNDTDATFLSLKAALRAAQVLHLPNFSVLFIIDYDMFGFSFGAILHEDGPPITLFSCPFMVQHLMVAAYERELIGIV
jgi:hypothetical protein